VTGANPTSVIATDFNGDGRLDLAVTNYYSNTVSILLGNGDGTFQNHVDFGVGGGASSVVAGDFNRDGRLDLAVTNSNSATFSLLLQNALATLSATSLTFCNQQIGTTSNPQAVTVTNSGSAPLRIFSMGITGTNSGDFAETNTCGSVLAGAHTGH
jgi:hypothetical protein